MTLPELGLCIQPGWNYLAKRNVCQKLGLRFIAHNGVRHRGPDVQLKCPDIQKCVSIRGDGNCFFRSISHIITGNQQQH